MVSAMLKVMMFTKVSFLWLGFISFFINENNKFIKLTINSYLLQLTIISFLISIRFLIIYIFY